VIIEKLANKIVYFKNAIEDPQRLLDELEIANNDESVHKVITPWVDWVSGDGDHVYGLRRFVTGSTVTSRPGNSEYIINTISDAMKNTAVEYAKILNINSDNIDFGKDFVINKYATNEDMGPHVDWNEQNSDLEYSFVVYLNDDYIGGEIYWENQGVQLKPEAGSIVLFPSKEPYFHGVTVVTQGNKIFIPHYWRTKGGI
jgi:predicted 2-oxoglutarate/Fe(II)-dependent dioxygenase YbiX